MNFRTATRAVPLLLVLCAADCGQKGELYLPEREPVPDPPGQQSDPAQAQEDDDEDEG